MSFNNNDEVIEIIIKDSTGRVFDKFKFNVHNKFIKGKVAMIMREKYNFVPIEDTKEEKIDWIKTTTDIL